MKQMTFADAEYAGKRKQTRKELFLIEMDRVVPWKGLIALIERHYPKGDGGRPAYPLMAMLRVHLMQNWFGYPTKPVVSYPDGAKRQAWLKCTFYRCPQRRSQAASICLLCSGQPVSEIILSQE